MPVTMKDVAKASGVSTFTVSAVINNKGRIGEATRNKVLKVVEELKYDPARNVPHARSTVTRTIGIVVPHADGPADSFFYRALVAAKNATRERGYDYKLFSEAEIQERAVDSFHKGRTQLQCDGMVVFTPQQPWQRYVGNMLAWDVPVALIRRRFDLPGLITINDDDYNGARLLMEHLHTQGHTRIAILGNNEMETGGATGRISAYRDYVREHGLAADPGLVITTDRFTANMENMVKTVRAETPSALFCYDDSMASVAIAALLRAGIRVPDEIAVAGYGNDPIAEQFYPSITTVNIPVEEMVTEACRQLMNRNAETLPESMELKYSNELIIREST